MSPTSSSPAPSFRRTFALVIGALGVLCGALFAVTALQGPRVSSVQADIATGAPQQLRLSANQPIAPVDPAQVVVTPAVPFTVDTSGTVIAVRFTLPLAYNTEYRVTVAGVHGPSRDRSSDFAATFTTGDPALLYLRRGAANGRDELVRTGLADTARTVVYSAATIEEFATVGRLVAVVTDGGEGVDNVTSTLSLVSLADGGVEQVPLPADGTVSQLRASASGSTLGFVFTGGDYQRTLFTIDLARGRDLVPVLDLTGEPMHVLGWQFVPGSESFVAQDIDRSTAVIAPTDAANPMPLGQYLTISHVSADGSTLTASDAYGFVSRGLVDLAERRIEPSPLAGSSPGAMAPYGGEVQVLSSGSRVQHVAVFNETTGRFDDYLTVDDGTTATAIYGTPGTPGSILSFAVSPNEQYVAVEIDPNVSASNSDRYRNPRPTSVTTVIVALADGRVVASVEGLGLEW